ncbi:FUSC family protein [Pontibacter fetidus]|uniref:FUSC family protein n=1 Tax=Pontibacter fetidus TaxID=2700082 RepID=A0A6B2H064_9BACT|nr:FUSC family protein [Pontibacter fetidus]NDK55703.1 FUSC family protein [Pontibacter fetidus]
MAARKYSIDADMILYIVRCTIGFLVGYTLYQAFPQYELYWTILSILLVLSPELKDSPKLTVERVKSNLIGSSVGLFCFVLPVPELVMMVLGIVFAIFVCHLFNLMNVARTAVVALIIVVIHEQETMTYWVAVERFLSVTLGCLIGLGISMATSFLSAKLIKKTNP